MSAKLQTAVEFLSVKYTYVNWLRNRDEITASEADLMRTHFLNIAIKLEREQHSRTWDKAVKSIVTNNLIYSKSNKDFEDLKIQ